MKPWQALVGAAAVAAATGCATTMEAERSLAQARAAYQAVQSDPHVSRYAPAELAQAGQMIARLEVAAPSASSEWIQHHAYLAEQQAQVAKHRAMARAAEAEVAGAREERERLAARTQAAQEARSAEDKRDAEVQKLNQEVQALRQRFEREKALAELRSQMAGLKARETDRGWVLTLANDALFDVNRTTLKPGAERNLEGLAQVLKQHPPREVIVEGYTDGPGSEEVNRLIAEMRAAAVKDVLVKQGVEPKRIVTRGFGQADERRVQISIVQPGAASAGR
jgi:outer membrane protein OmpA-like peptidoglycan-associated protein